MDYIISYNSAFDPNFWNFASPDIDKYVLLFLYTG